MKAPEAGATSPLRLKTAHDIRRTSEGVYPIAPGDSRDSALVGVIHLDPAGILAGLEATEETLVARKAAIKACLTPFEAAVHGRLERGRPQAVWLMAWETGHGQGDIRRARSGAFAKTRRLLLSIKHPTAVDGRGTAAVLMSLVQSCRRLGNEPFAYLRDVLDRVSILPASRIDDLLPDRRILPGPSGGRGR